MATHYQFGDGCLNPQIQQNSTGSAVVSSSSNLDCLIQQLEQPTVTVDWSITAINVEEVGAYFGGALLLWSIGYSIGLMINVIRRAR